MAMLQVNALTPRSSEPALPGTWKLAAGRAITLEPRTSGVLKVAHGQLWATYDGPHRGALNDMGDCVLGVGEQLRVQAGQRLVIEPWNGGAPAYFSWDPVAQPVPLPRFATLVQPLADLRLALVFGGGAIARLFAGVAQIALRAVLPSRRSIEERACNRHGALG